MNKRLKLIIAGLITVLILNAGIGAAWAYFTTYDEAAGSVVITVDTHITEDEFDGEKHVHITNNDDSKAFVWVRARAFVGGKYGIADGYPRGEGWEEIGEWSYYGLPLAPAETTPSLDFRISGIPEADKSNIDQIVNVAVVYECIPVSFDENNEPMPWEASDWEVKSREEAE